MHQLKRILFIACGSVVLLFSYQNCEKTGRSFSILATEEEFNQNVSFSVIPQKIDILWIVDNSGSMETSQKNLTDNFHRFIDRFKNLEYDFHLAVQSTDGYLRPNPPFERRRLRDGGIFSIPNSNNKNYTHSGTFVMTPSTKDLVGTFLTNATLGILGSGDERAFQSIEETLNLPANSDFRRPDAYLAVIVVSDEDDFSATDLTNYNNTRNYNAPQIRPVSYYKNYLEQLAGPGKYSVSAITITDETCRQTLDATTNFDRTIGRRIMELANTTGGTTISLCGNFGDGLQLISDKIVNEILVPAYSITREPNFETIRVAVAGKYIQEDALNGWTYDPASMTIRLHGSSIPTSSEEKVTITYDPKSLNN